MPHRFYAAVVISFILTSLYISPARALTPAELLNLKEAGVSEDTIQRMSQNEAKSRISSGQVE